MSVCSFWFDGIGPLSWRHCCEEHDKQDDIADKLYYDQEFFRLLSHQDLRDCVNRVLPGMGTVMYWGLILFGPIYQWLTK